MDIENKPLNRNRKGAAWGRTLWKKIYSVFSIAIPENSTAFGSGWIQVSCAIFLLTRVLG